VKLLLFDVDQTLINTGGAGVRALNRACKKILSVENAMDGIAPHGKTDPGIVREILIARFGTTGKFDECLKSILDAYLFFLREEVAHSPTYRVLPGIVEILQEFSRRSDVLVGLATGNIEPGARIKLERGALNRYFTFGGFGSDSESRTELVRSAAQRASAQHGSAIDPRWVFVIGDTPRDVEAGREAGFRTIGVATGHYTAGELRASGADCVVVDFGQGRDAIFQTIDIREQTYPNQIGAKS
jgi:phosphoglycolate phosphatase-like HAD superfamily hydrolase